MSKKGVDRGEDEKVEETAPMVRTTPAPMMMSAAAEN
jgi:hypothetical protein